MARLTAALIFLFAVLFVGTAVGQEQRQEKMLYLQQYVLQGYYFACSSKHQHFHLHHLDTYKSQFYEKDCLRVT